MRQIAVSASFSLACLAISLYAARMIEILPPGGHWRRKSLFAWGSTPRQLPLPVEHEQTGRNDDHYAEPGQTIGKIAEEHVAEDRRTYDLQILKWRKGGNRGAIVSHDNQDMPGRGDDAEQCKELPFSQARPGRGYDRDVICVATR